jgi:hypothetical protein
LGLNGLCIHESTSLYDKNKGYANNNNKTFHEPPCQHQKKALASKYTGAD